MSLPALAWWLPILLLVASNIFMTFAWYGHLRHAQTSLPLAIVASWAIAFLEYCLAVPANRLGHQVYTLAQLKTIQEVITLVVFVAFSTLYMREPVGLQHLAGFALILGGAVLIFRA